MNLRCLFGHQWNNNGKGCVCKVCGNKRDAGHSWDACTCTVCKKRSPNHDFRYYRPTAVNMSGVMVDMCVGECRVCGITDTQHHDDHATEKICILKCNRCGRSLEKHIFSPVPDRCADVCSVCGEERDYKEIALDEKNPVSMRAKAIDRLKAASMMPKTLYQNCQKGKHVYIRTRESQQQFRGGTSYIEYQCVVCGKKETEFDYGD